VQSSCALPCTDVYAAFDFANSVDHLRSRGSQRVSGEPRIRKDIVSKELEDLRDSLRQFSFISYNDDREGQ
jgi:hypothetical protein